MDALTKKFSEEINLHKGIVHKICNFYRKDKADREDLFQEIVYNAWHAYPRFEGRSKFSTWLYRVAINTALHHNRKDKFFGKTSGLDMIQDLTHTESDNERYSSLWKAIDLLDSLEKSLVLLYLDELSYKEISEITGITENNVGVKLNRIKTKIKEIITKYGA